MPKTRRTAVATARKKAAPARKSAVPAPAQEARADDRAAALRRAAFQCFAEAGFHETTVDDICRKAGVSKGTFYWYFESKELVFVQILEAWADEVEGEIRTQFTDAFKDQDPLPALLLALGREGRRGRRLLPVSRHVPWDVDQIGASRDGRLLAAQVNVDGRSEVRLFDARSRKERPAPALPPGGVRALGFHPQAGELAFSLDSAKGPGEVWSLDPNAAKGAAPVQWTRALAAPGVDPQAFGDQQIVRWKSFDGRSISGLLSLPPERFGGKRPVLIDIHGGPEAQAKVGFMGRYNHFVEDLGIAIVQPTCAVRRATARPSSRWTTA